MKNKIVAIHQPNFFPWLGYFDKIVKSDVFIIMDNVQFQKTGGMWTNRTKILIGGEEKWLTVPVKRSYHGTRKIRDMIINNDNLWRDKTLRTIEVNYARAPYFKKIYPLIFELFKKENCNLSKFNINIIKTLASHLDIQSSKFILGSSLNVKGKSTDLLISMVKSVGGNSYLCGGGSKGYQEDDKIIASGINLIYQNFKHPIYSQINSKEFIGGLSIIDSLMNIGFKNISRLLNFYEN